jgi:hypothetical protein
VPREDTSPEAFFLTAARQPHYATVHKKLPSGFKPVRDAAASGRLI